MESLLDVFKIVELNWWMASVELRDAFHSIPAHQQL